MPGRTDLNGLHVLVTRPAHQAGHLCDLIATAGGRPIRFPALSIRDLSASSEVEQRLARLDKYHIAIFISPNAVRYGLSAILRHGRLPEKLKLATVGQGSAVALKQELGREADIVPTENFDSEALLALPPMQQVNSQRILIVRGEGGRELLAETLRQRGATVDYLEVYRRECPAPENVDPEWLEKTDIITITSSEALQNLVSLTSADQRSLLLAKALIVVSTRTATLAKQLGFSRPALITQRAGDEAILQTLLDWTHSKLPETQP